MIFRKSAADANNRGDMVEFITIDRNNEITVTLENGIRIQAQQTADTGVPGCSRSSFFNERG